MTGSTPDPRTAKTSPSGKVRVPVIDGHFAPRTIRSLVRALLRHLNTHRLGRAETRRVLAKIEELQTELLQIRKLQQALKKQGSKQDSPVAGGGLLEPSRTET